MYYKRLLGAISIILLAGCASLTTANPDDGAYVGVATGKYASVHYMTEENTLYIAFENTTIFPMKNIIIAVEQQTTAGSQETQYSLRLLRKGSVFSIQIPLSVRATGTITVRYYFVPVTMDDKDNDAGFSRFYEDSVSFKLFV